MYIIDEEGFHSILCILREQGYTTIGPKVHNGAIVYDEIAGINDLPRGWIDEQGPGSYSLNQNDGQSMFGYVVGPHSWKKFLFPQRKQLFSVTRHQPDFGFSDSPDPVAPVPKYAFVGVRACELQAIAIQDRVFCSNGFIDSMYSSLRSDAFILAENCTRAGGNCFCVSMNTGPKVGAGFDIALTEITADSELRFVLEVGSKKGEAILEQIPHDTARPEDVARAEAAVRSAAEHMGKALDTTNIKQLLYDNSEHPVWDDVAKRCLSCANCTMVCPTCFCSTVEDTTDLTGDHAERSRRWDSCFTVDFAKVAGGNFRSSTKSRYRQWMTHKLASWIDQFGTSGCVGCGRCITWCPVGIDITEEVRAIRGKSAHLPVQSGSSE